MFTQGRIRVIALAAADCICISAVWALMVVGYWALGKMLGAWFPILTGGNYNPVDYLRFWPIVPGFVFCNALASLYHGNWVYPAAQMQPVEEFRRLVGMSLLTHAGLVVYLVFAYQTTDNQISRFVVVLSGLGVALLAQSCRNVMRWMLLKMGIGQIPVLVSGGGEVAKNVMNILADNAYVGMRVVGYFEGTDRVGRHRRWQEWGVREIEERGVRYLGPLSEIVPEAKRRDIKILLACQEERFFRVQMRAFAGWFTYIEYIPTAKVFPVFGSRTVGFDGVGGLEMVNQGRMKIKRVQKRLTDMLLAVIAILVALPFFLVLPLLVKLTSRGPVFYRQKRLGKGGREIRVWKFRSMFQDADARLQRLLASDPAAAEEWAKNFKLRHDPRVTPFGKFLRKTSLDELPQLFNVFLGDMALIGPRPIVEQEVAYYGDSYSVFSSVKPGVTGLWQVSGRSDTDYVRRVALDTYYVLNWSPWMDVWILIRTVYVVLLMRGAR